MYKAAAYFILGVLWAFFAIWHNGDVVVKRNSSHEECLFKIICNEKDFNYEKN